MVPFSLGIDPLRKISSFFQINFALLKPSCNKYDNIFFARDLNTDVLDSKCDVNNHFSILMDNFDLKNMVKSLTCFKSIKGTLIDILLANKPICFQKTII